MFNGSSYDPALDDTRLRTQMGKVYSFMKDGHWHTLQEIHLATAEPEASVSAQLRHLRKPRFGGYIVDKRHRGERCHGLFEYRLYKRAPQPELFPVESISRAPEASSDMVRC